MVERLERKKLQENGSPSELNYLSRLEQKKYHKRWESSYEHTKYRTVFMKEVSSNGIQSPA